MAERPKIGELLVAAGVIDTAALEAALEKQRSEGGRLGKILLGMGVLDEEMLVRTVARQLDMPVAWLKGKQVKASVLAKLPGHLARKHHCLPVMVDRKGPETLLIAMEDPSDATALDEVAIAAGCPVRVVLAAPSELEEALARHYPAAREPEPVPAPVSEPAPELDASLPDADAEPGFDDDEEEELLLTDSVGGDVEAGAGSDEADLERGADLDDGGDADDLGGTGPGLRAPAQPEPGESARGDAPDLGGPDDPFEPAPRPARDRSLDLGADADPEPAGDADAAPDPGADSAGEIGSYRASGLDLGLPDEPGAPLDSDADLGLDLGPDAGPEPELDASPRRGVPYAGDSLDDAIDEVRGANFQPEQAVREPNSEDVGESLFPDDPLEMTVAPPRAPAAPAFAPPSAQSLPRDPELRAVVELLIERGLLDPDELARRLLASRGPTEP
jgi:hypothetical protein